MQVHWVVLSYSWYKYMYLWYYNIVDIMVHTSTRSSISNAMHTLMPAASMNLTSVTNVSAGAS